MAKLIKADIGKVKVVENPRRILVKVGTNGAVVNEVVNEEVRNQKVELFNHSTFSNQLGSSSCKPDDRGRS